MGVGSLGAGNGKEFGLEAEFEKHLDWEMRFATSPSGPSKTPLGVY